MAGRPTNQPTNQPTSRLIDQKISRRLISIQFKRIVTFDIKNSRNPPKTTKSLCFKTVNFNINLIINIYSFKRFYLNGFDYLCIILWAFGNLFFHLS